METIKSETFSWVDGWLGQPYNRVVSLVKSVYGYIVVEETTFTRVGDHKNMFVPNVSAFSEKSIAEETYNNAIMRAKDIVDMSNSYYNQN